MQTKREEINRMVQDVKSLPALPGIVVKLRALAESDAASLQIIARLISSDQILSAKVLKLVNSPFYGFPGRVSTVSNALILLGVNVVKALVLSSSIFDLMEENVVGLWEHSLGAGVAANIITKRLALPDGEEISTAALLHDIGKVIIKIKLKEEAERIRLKVDGGEVSIREAEKEVLDVDHAEIGGWLGKTWCLPEKLIEPIACHHDPVRSVTYADRTAVVHLSDILIKASGFGYSGDDLVPRIQEAAWKKLNLSDHVLREIVDEIEDKLIEVKNFSLEIQSSHEGKV